MTVDYRDALALNASDSNCALYYQIKEMERLLNTFKSFNQEEILEVLKKYGLKRDKYIKHCQRLLDYTKKRFEQVRMNVKNGDYPHPNSKYKWFT